MEISMMVDKILWKITTKTIACTFIANMVSIHSTFIDHVVCAFHIFIYKNVINHVV